MGSKLRGTHFLRPVVAERNEKILSLDLTLWLEAIQK